jgi:hypothetical protein
MTPEATIKLARALATEQGLPIADLTVALMQAQQLERIANALEAIAKAKTDETRIWEPQRS